MAIIEFDGKKPKMAKGVFVSDYATVIGEVSAGAGSSIWPGAVLRGDMHFIKLGKNVSVQDNSVMHGTLGKYSTTVGDNVSVGHNAIVHGCRIGSNCIIGMGSIVLEGATVGDWCIIGAGAVVPEGATIPSNSIALGIPAKVVRKVTAEHKARITRNWQAYTRWSKKLIAMQEGGTRI